MGSNLDFVIGELNEQKESWKADHDEAMAVYDLEDAIKRGIAFFSVIRLADESWTKKVQKGEEKFDAKKVRSIREQYEWWLAPCAKVLSQLAEAEKSYCRVENAEYFRTCYSLAKKLMFVDIEGLIESSEQAAKGNIEPYDPFAGEVLSGVSDQVDAKGSSKLSRTSKPRSRPSHRRAG